MKNRLVKIGAILALLVATMFAGCVNHNTTGYQTGDTVYRWVTLSEEVIPNSGITYVGKYYSGSKVYFTFTYRGKEYYTDVKNGNDAVVHIGTYGFTITEYSTGTSKIRVGFRQL